MAKRTREEIEADEIGQLVKLWEQADGADGLQWSPVVQHVALLYQKHTAEWHDYLDRIGAPPVDGRAKRSGKYMRLVKHVAGMRDQPASKFVVTRINYALRAWDFANQQSPADEQVDASDIDQWLDKQGGVYRIYEDDKASKQATGRKKKTPLLLPVDMGMWSEFKAIRSDIPMPISLVVDAGTSVDDAVKSFRAELVKFCKMMAPPVDEHDKVRVVGGLSSDHDSYWYVPIDDPLANAWEVWSWSDVDEAWEVSDDPLDSLEAAEAEADELRKTRIAAADDEIAEPEAEPSDPPPATVDHSANGGITDPESYETAVWGWGNCSVCGQRYKLTISKFIYRHPYTGDRRLQDHSGDRGFTADEQCDGSNKPPLSPGDPETDYVRLLEFGQRHGRLVFWNKITGLWDYEGEYPIDDAMWRLQFCLDNGDPDWDERLPPQDEQPDPDAAQVMVVGAFIVDPGGCYPAVRVPKEDKRAGWYEIYEWNEDDEFWRYVQPASGAGSYDRLEDAEQAAAKLVKVALQTAD